MKPKTMMIDDVMYIREDMTSSKVAVNTEGMERSVIRSYGAGVFVGYVSEKKAELNGVNITLLKAKRIHYWDGANSLTQFALDGVQSGDNCKFTDEVDSQYIANVIEIIPMTEKASKNIDEVKAWKQ